MERPMPSPALAEALRADREFEDAPLGGWYGERSLPKPEPTRPAPATFVIDPPPWSVHYQGDEPRPVRPPSEPPKPLLPPATPRPNWAAEKFDRQRLAQQRPEQAVTPEPEPKRRSWRWR